MKRIAIVLSSFLLVGLAHAASFDCAKASTKVEHLICGNPTLSSVDEAMATRYKTILKRGGGTSEVTQSQKDWLKERDKCEDISCLNAAYIRRIDDLDIILGEERKEPSPGVNGRLKLVMSKSNDMCQHMYQLMVDDMQKYGRTFDRFDGFVSSHDEFTAVQWKPGRASYEAYGKTLYTNVDTALFDLNNDGVLDFVVRMKGMLSGMRADAIFMLDRSMASRTNSLTTKDLFGATNQIHLAGGIYALSGPFAGRLESLWLLAPFIYHGVTYVYMQSLYRRDEAVGGDFAVIAKYHGGNIGLRRQSEKMDDVCYIERSE